METKSTNVWILWAVLVVVLASSGTLQADTNNPSGEACVKYAEADLAFERAKADALALLYETEKANGGGVSIVSDNRVYVISELIDLYGDMLSLIRDLGEFSIRSPERGKDFYQARKDDAQRELNQAYYDNYTDGDGVTSDEWVIMSKLLNHHRGLCTELYGL